MKSSSPHDALFKAAFEKPEHAAGELRALLPPGLVERIDWSTLTVQPGSFVDPDLRERRSDLLFSVALDGEAAFVYVLFEHQSQPDRFLVFRMLVYVVRVWERHVREFPDKPYLPPVLPVLLHHSDTGWTAPTRLSELLRPGPDSLPDLRGFVAEMGLWIDDISHIDDQVLRARALAPFAAITLALLRDGRRPGRALPALDAWPDALAAVARAPDGVAALEQLFRYISLVAQDLDFAQLRNHVSRLLPPAAEDRIMTTIAEQLRNEGRDLGIKEGRDLGIKEGKASILLKQLELKFGELGPAVRERLGAADQSTLDRWCERVLTATTLDAVFD